MVSRPGDMLLIDPIFLLSPEYSDLAVLYVEAFIAHEG